MHVLLFTIGSHGDVHPFVGLGITLRRRGHRVTLITNEHFKPLAQKAGIEFAQMGSDEHFRQMLNDPDLWHKYRGFDAVFMRGVIPYLEESYRVIESLHVPGETVMAASTLGLAARIAQEKLGIPTASVHIQPAIMRTVHDLPRLPGLPMGRWMPKWLRKWIWDGGDKYFLDPKLAPPINELRLKLGLSEPVKGIMNDWWHSPDRIIGLWPDWYGPRQPDWPERLRIVGFPLYDEEGITPLSPELDYWLGGGDPPIAFTPGSAMIQGGSFFMESTKACVHLNRRGLLLTRHKDQIPRDLPPQVKHIDYAPFSTLLPRCAALVHHGGIGTTAQTLRAGIPQLIMPMSHDQFDNAERVKKLGAGDEIKLNRYRAPEVVQRLQPLLISSKVRESCHQISAKFAGQNALEQAADLTEFLLSAQVPQNALLSLG